MSIGRSKEEQELTSFLSKTLVQKEVVEPMNKIGWSHGTPPPPDYSTPGLDGQPVKPAEGAPGQAPAASGQPASDARTEAKPKADDPAPNTEQSLTDLYESLRDPETGLIMKKYRTAGDAIKGSAHLANMAKQAFKDRDDALAEVAKLRDAELQPRNTPPAGAGAPQPQAVGAPSREMVDRAKADYDAVLSKIVEGGGVIDAEAKEALSKAQNKLVEETALYSAKVVAASEKQAEAAVQAEWNAVDAYMMEHHPDAARFAEEVALHLNSGVDPLLTKAFNALMKSGDKIGATEHLWESFKRHHGEQMSAEKQAKDEKREQELAAREQVRNEQVEQARKDAGVITGSPGGAGIHENRRPGHSREEIEAARAAMQVEGDAPGSPAARRFREMIIGPSLDPSIFGPQR